VTRPHLILLLIWGSWHSSCAYAQQAGLPVVGFLNSASPASYGRELNEFHAGLKESGHADGRTLAIQYRWADGRYDRLAAMAAEIVGRRVAVISANGPAVSYAMSATKTIPIVFTAGFDPIRLGLVDRLNRPGGNVTGVSILNVEMAPKRLELLRELLPGLRRVGLLINPTNPNAESLAQDVQSAAAILGLELTIARASSPAELSDAFAHLVRTQVGGLVIGNDPFFTTQSGALASRAFQFRIPAIYSYREFASRSGLMSYGGSLAATYRLAGEYTGRILNGDKPADLPVQQTTRIELVINLATARAFGLTVPSTLLARADEVIE
jgi:putative ABC transport system substrate-binding protein